MSAPLEIKTPPLAANCLVCGIPLVGLAARFLEVARHSSKPA